MSDKSNKRIQQGGFFLLAMLSGALAMVGTLWLILPAGQAPAAASVENEAALYRHFNLFGEIFQVVRDDYVESREDKELVEAAIRGMMSALDPHSSYLSEKNYQRMQVQTKGEFGGLGIEVTMKNGLVEVIAPIADTPAEAAGIQSGDLITHIDGEQVPGLSLGEAVERMRGKPGSKIDLTIRRAGVDAPLEIIIIRAIIKISAVKSWLKGDIGYIRITTFNQKVASSVRQTLASFRDQLDTPLSGLILDLRNNPGGLLGQAAEVSDIFLSGGEIVSTRGRDGTINKRFNARPGDLLEGVPMIILVNGGSASASEIVAGALSDQRRAILLGTRSFGKGSVQTVRALSEGRGALRLTTAFYHTPSGRKIQAQGVAPDIIVEPTIPEADKDSARVAGETLLRGHLSGDEEESSGSSAYVPRDEAEDSQLQHALSLLQKLARAQDAKQKSI